MEFNKWEVFVNDDQTRTFLSLEVIAGGLPEVSLRHFACNFECAFVIVRYVMVGLQNLTLVMHAKYGIF